MIGSKSSTREDSIKLWKLGPSVLVIIAIVAVGSFGVATINDPNNKVPVAIGDTVMSGSPIQFDKDNELALDVTGASAVGSEILTRQKVVVNFVMDVSEDANIVLPLENLSADQRVARIRAIAPSTLIVDVEEGTGTSEVRLLGHNEWMFAISSGADNLLNVEVSSTDAGFFPLVLELSDP